MGRRYALMDATGFAAMKHAKQVRKYSGDPYLTHLMRVAQKLESLEVYFPVTDEMLQAAVLHDVIEDTDCTADELRARFGDTVTGYVEALSIDFEAGKRQERMAKYAAQLHAAPAEVQRIKACDLWDNNADIRENDPGFHVVYLREVLAVAEGLDKLGPLQPKLVRLLNGEIGSLLE
ncbi:MAG TPA: HD domain-containing protein [Patescibacteria group bacterium]|nr:HD domain-containing protein [Patescibacteria group bacterium]